MIKYALRCAEGHDFEAWFPDSAAYEAQAAAGHVACPTCGSLEVRKQIMAPAVRTRKAADPVPAKPSAPPQRDPEAPPGPERLAEIAAQVRAHIAKTHADVGDRFAEEARAMHRGEKDPAPIIGETTPQEAKALKDEGVPAAPLPPMFAPNAKKALN